MAAVGTRSTRTQARSPTVRVPYVAYRRTYRPTPTRTRNPGWGRYRTGRLAGLADLKIHTGCNAFLLHHARLFGTTSTGTSFAHELSASRGDNGLRKGEREEAKLYRVPVTDGTLQVLQRS
eukprot:scaffold297203_cov16-Prasinocladus_malaysianus.AAC.1